MGAAESQLGIETDVKQNQVNFLINGKEYTVNTEQKIGPKSVLVDYIRDEAGLKGTKYMCREGGCGACVVTVKSKDPVTGVDITRAVNSCLTPVFSCDGWDISTIEKLGNKKDGYHKLQKRLTNFSGTQCGYCTPGMIMNMYSLMESKPTNLNSKEIEDNFDGNACRCTGYRPIMDAFKSMASDASEELRRICIEIEDCSKTICHLNNKCCKSTPDSEWTLIQNGLESSYQNTKVYLSFMSGEQWVKPNDLATLFEAIQKFKAEGIAYRLVGGNTATGKPMNFSGGIYKEDGPYGAYVDMNNIPELRKNTIDKSGVVLGGGTTLVVAIEALKKASELEGYEYTAVMSKHLLRVANVPIRNVATIAGNLMTKNAHREFPSDVFILLESIGAKINIAAAPSLQTQYTIEEFITMDMNGKVIVSLHLPSLPASAGYHFRSFKITKRFQNAHAYVNAGFLFKIDPNSYKFLEKPRICYGGIKPTFVHSTQTETFLEGKSCDPSVLSQALNVLEKEVDPESKDPDATPAYRKALTQSLFYKTVLAVLGSRVKSNLQSGGIDIEHHLTRGKQTYDVDESAWPINKPVVKLEADIQCSGEAEYTNDIHPQPGELSGAFVLTTVANADLKSVDASEALKIPGVVGFIQAKDIPGNNNYMVFFPEPEEVFIKDKVRAAGEAIGLIIAESREIALSAAKHVKVEYMNIQQPILTIPAALEKAEKEGITDEQIYTNHALIKKVSTEPSKNIIKGEIRTGSQYHFQMETQTTVCIPKDGNFEIYSATQWIDHVIAAVSNVLQLPNNNINVQVRRLGGGYGSKVNRSSQVAAACAVASYTTNKPVRVVLDLETNMKLVGKRLPYYGTYEVEFDDNGKIESLTSKIICDTGSGSNISTSLLAMLLMQNAYNANGWKIESGKASTNTVSNTVCRAPGSPQGIMFIETIMEHVAAHLKKDPFEVRMINFIKEGDDLLCGQKINLSYPLGNCMINTDPNAKFEGENYLHRMIEEMKVSGEYEERKKFVNVFNQNNRWKKRGIAMIPMRYPQRYFRTYLPAQVTVYHTDGSIAVLHGGIEMGQGINTKVAQVVAHTLNVPFEKVSVKPTNSFVTASSTGTGGATTSEVACYAAMQACKLLNDRMAPIKKKMKDPTWMELVVATYKEGLDLSARYMPSPADQLKGYNVWGLNLTEVEVDMLTGEYKIVRMDVIQDAGKSLSQEVDIGQIEGCIVMGLGLWTTEKLQYDQNTGELLTPNTWEYKVPFPKDIPEDLRITLLKNAPNPFGILSSKATGEPPLCLASCILFAIRNAIDSARADAGNTEYYPIDGPISPEDILRLSLSTKEKFSF